MKPVVKGYYPWRRVSSDFKKLIGYEVILGKNIIFHQASALILSHASEKLEMVKFNHPIDPSMLELLISYAL